MRETLDGIHAMLNRELDDCVKKGIKSHEDLDVVKDILSSIKNIYRIIEHMDKETMDMDMEREMERGNSYRMYPRMYTMDHDHDRDYGYSERGYYISPMNDGRYSGNTSKEEMVKSLKEMMRDTDNPEMKKAISECITVMEK